MKRTAPPASKPRRSSPISAPFRLLLAGGLVGAMIHVSNLSGPEFRLPLPPSPADVRSEPDYEARVAEVRAKLERLSGEFSDAQTRELEATAARVEAILKRASDQAPERAGQSAAPLQGWGNIANCVGWGAKDQLFKETQLESYVAMSMLPATTLIVETRAELQVTFEALQQRTLARADDFQKEALAVADRAGVTPVDVALDEEAYARLTEGARTLVAKSESAAFAVALEVALVRLTAAQIAKVLGPMITRLAGTGAAAGTAAAVDGPIPVGDVIGVLIAAGGTVWTVWDVKNAVQAHQALPGQIEASIREQLDHLAAGSVATLEALSASSGLFVLPELE